MSPRGCLNASILLFTGSFSLIPAIGEIGRMSQKEGGDVKMVVDVLQRAVLQKAREIHCRPLMA
jgi:hypothetical protein